MAGTSLGMIETRGYVAAICGADAAMKAANVEFLGYAHTSPALITIRFQGDVAAVQAAVQAATAAASSVGQVVAQLIIPRPDRQLSGYRRSDSPALSSAAPSPGPESLPQPVPTAAQTIPGPPAATAPDASAAPKRKRPAARNKRNPNSRASRPKAAAKQQPEPTRDTPAKPVTAPAKEDSGTNDQ